MNTESKKPAHEVRIGSIKAAIWENASPNGNRYSVTLTRIYKKEGETSWNTSSSLGREDLLVAAKVLDLAHTWTYEQ